MKKLIIFSAIVLFAFTARADVKNTVFNMGYGYFYTSLSPYGSWIEIDYGVVVWKPAKMRRSWAPYRLGSWVWTVDGWYWDSYEPFGYVVYHYGRWYYDDYYGWIWIPDHEWAPSWVEWRYDDDYVGWAPLPPYAVFSISVGIHFTTTYYTPYHHWHFVKYRYICEPYVYRHFVGPKYKYRIYSNTRYRTNYSYNDGRIINRGVDIEDVRRRSGQKIRERDIQRYSDHREFEKVRGKNRNDDNIRVFVASRDELKRNDLGNVDIQRSDRKSSLDVSKVELGDRRSGLRTDEKKSERTRTTDDRRTERSSDERINTDSDKRNRNDEMRRNEERKSDVNIREQRKSEDKRINTERRNEDRVKRNESVEEIRRSPVEQKRNEVRIERKKEDTRQQRTFEVPERKETDVRKQREQDNRKQSDNNVRIQRDSRNEERKQENRTQTFGKRQEEQKTRVNQKNDNQNNENRSRNTERQKRTESRNSGSDRKR